MLPVRTLGGLACPGTKGSGSTYSSPGWNSRAWIATVGEYQCSEPRWVKRVDERAGALMPGSQPTTPINCSSFLPTFWLVCRALLLVRRGAAAGGDLLLICLYGARRALPLTGLR